MAAKAEAFKFEAETKSLLHLMIHSLYTDRELFLRELISNASDALDRLRFESLTNDDLLEGDSRFELRLEVDRAARTLTISDSGKGMSRDEVIANIGTIAKSGTGEFQQLFERDGSCGARGGADWAIRRRVLFSVHGGRPGYVANALRRRIGSD
jgi:molecular chaperone HtpG